MVSFILSIIALIVGYVVYGKVVEKCFGANDDIETPATRLEDGVDFVPMPEWKIFLIQFLNIAGLGPIFGAIAGAMWGPAAFLWIVFGCIFAGAVHDYLSGMLSVRHDGASIPEVVGKYLGNGFRKFMIVFSVILLILTGVVFVSGPAGILHGLISSVSKQTFLYIIFAYYLLATLVPIDKLIGKIYPIFGICLLVMAVGVGGALIINGAPIPEVAGNLVNMHSAPDKHPLFPMLFITIACGAISGFHSTQSPLMARCITKESQGRRIFLGAMIAEGIVALVWAAAAMSFFGGVPKLNSFMVANKGNAGLVVNQVCGGLLGKVGGVLAILGVVACPITSGDTAFRSARLTIADSINYDQISIKKRLLISIPLFAVGFILTLVDFSKIWRYFGWSNQTLATIVLWTGAMYLLKKGRQYWIATVPAVFMTAVCTTYILVAPEGFKLSMMIGLPVGIIAAVIALLLFLKVVRKVKMKSDIEA
ncbi:carbon starvation protein CstA [Clostridium novyi A str. 4552]|uniref:Carbon starvation protein CstA n=1 Tax=Clostridium novyi A str. 4552 TaxID=1444289 RepID=A0A0A0IDK5_CLONO|nr:carbon starvation protein A [Clostridium novyi]KGM97670.1 carbon starvation protein CstA [Clostridium novyi A str. 4552]